MPMDSRPTEQAMQLRVQRLSASLEGLNARIARLAAALGVALDQDSGIGHALQRASAPAGEGLRQRRMREELRGLLVLRYRMAIRCSHRLGAPITRALFACAEEQLRRTGFAPGADGIDLRALDDGRP